MSVLLNQQDSPSTASQEGTPVARQRKLDYLTQSKSALSWIFSIDHKRIAVMYLGAIVFCFLLGGLLAFLIRAELWTAKPDLVSADTYNRTFSMHGVIMVLLVAIPGIPAVFGNFVLPLMLGAKGLAFPRVGLGSLYLYVCGAVLCVCALLADGIDTGWTFSLPYATSATGSITLVLIGACLLGGSSILTGVNFLASLHSLRAPGMTWSRMPLFLWALYASSLIQILAAPVFCLTIILLLAERNFGFGIFNSSLGGDPVWFENLFWFYSHPATYLVLLPAIGVVSEILSIHSRKRISGYRAIAICCLAIALLGCLAWGQHLFTGGQSGSANTIFSLLSVLIAVPAAIIVLCWLSTLHRGSIAWNTPMLYAVLFIPLFAIAQLSSLFLATLSTNMHLQGSCFSVAHVHYTMLGAGGFGFLAALHHWWPKMIGRNYQDGWGVISAWLLFTGFNLAFFPLFIMGAQGLPSRMHSYPAEFEVYQQVANLGGYLMGFALTVIATNLMHSIFWGQKAQNNPWGGVSLDWQCSTPPVWNNFPNLPLVPDSYDYSELRYDEADQTFRGTLSDGP